MMNWNNLRVEQEIAQERYQHLIRQREIDRFIGPQPSLFRLTIAGLGRRLVSWVQVGNLLRSPTVLRLKTFDQIRIYAVRWMSL